MPFEAFNLKQRELAGAAHLRVLGIIVAQHSILKVGYDTIMVVDAIPRSLVVKFPRSVACGALAGGTVRDCREQVEAVDEFGE